MEGRGIMDFTKYLEQNINKFYGGANGNKRAIKINDEIYMLKLSPKKEKIADLEYTNSCISEYLGSKIYATLNIPVQEVILGTVTINNKTKYAVACKDFTKPGIILQEFALIKNGCIESSQNGYGVELSEILDSFEEQQVVPNAEITKRFWQMFVVDAFIGNFDRHNGNWGFLIDTINNTGTLAPVYDCGSCLYPQAGEEIKKKILSDENELNNRIYVFPNSEIKINNQKINYYKFLTETDNKDCVQVLKEIAPEINLNTIDQIINDTELLSELEKTFYKTMLKERYEKIIKVAYEKQTNQKLY